MSIHHRATPRKIRKARKFRRRQTRAERAFWELVRQDRLGVRFWRQAVLLGWIVDFWCPKLKLIIEIDGPSHDDPERQAYDARRTEVLERELGAKVIRFTNREVISSPVLVEARMRCLIESAR